MAVLPAAAPDARRMLRRSYVLALTYMTAFNVATPILPLYLAERGASPWLVGAMISTSGLIPLLLGVHVGALVDRYGVVATTRLSAAFFCASIVPLLTQPNAWTAAILYGVINLGHLGMTVANQASVAQWSTPSTRASAYGYFTFWVSAGNVIGPIAGGYTAERLGFAAAFVLMLAFSTFSVAMSSRIIEPAAPGERTVSLANAHTAAIGLLRLPGMAMVMFIAFLIIVPQSLKQTYYPLFLREHAFGKSLIGVIFAINHIAAMTVRPALGELIRRYGAARVLIAATLLGSVGFALIPTLPVLWAQILATIFLGASMGFTQPITMSLTAGAVDAGKLGVALGVRLTVQRVGMIAGPLLFGIGVARWGVGAGFYGAVIVLGITTMIVARFADRIAAVTDRGRRRAADAGRPEDVPAPLAAGQPGRA
jgi:MFS family permease